MSEGTVTSETQPPAAAPEGPTCGERLAEARRELQITVLEIAKELRLDEAKVRGLERNDFDMLGAPVFTKGHMRKYAQLVGVDTDDVLADYYKLTRSAGMPPVVLEHPRIRQESSLGRWLVAAAVLVLVLLAYWFIAIRGVPKANLPGPAAEPTAQLEFVSEEPILEVVEPAPSSDLPDDESAYEAPAVATIREAPVAISTQPDPTVNAVDDGQVQLALSFSGECWTEISDADGRRLYFDMGRSGASVDLNGNAPFTVLLGDAQNVSIKVNGEDYTIPATGRNGRTARFTLLKP